MRWPAWLARSSQRSKTSRRRSAKRGRRSWSGPGCTGRRVWSLGYLCSWLHLEELGAEHLQRIVRQDHVIQAEPVHRAALDLRWRERIGDGADNALVGRYRQMGADVGDHGRNLGGVGLGRRLDGDEHTNLPWHLAATRLGGSE